jgi:hypothetical protein
VRHGVRHVQEERRVTMPLDEAHRALRVPGCELRLIGVGLDDLVAVDEGKIRIEVLLLRMPGPHVVRIGQAEVLVEAVLLREKRLQVAQVPLAENGRRIRSLLQHLRDRHLVGVDAVLGRVVERAQDAHPV